MRKKMKRTLMAFLFSYALAQPSPCQEKDCMAGVGLTSFARGSAEIIFSHGFGRHWSVTAEASVSYIGLEKEKSLIEVEHSAEFTSDITLPEDPDLHCERIRFNWWMTEVFNGFSLSAGVQSGSSTGPDIVTEAGYTLKIWKGLCISAGIRVPIMKGLRESGIGAHNIRAGIYYRF